jgi:spore coat protein U-like protein
MRPPDGPPRSPASVALRRKLATLAAVGACVLPAGAQSLTGNLVAQIQLQSGCVLAGNSGSITGLNFGVLDFGTWPSAFVGVATATATGGAGVAGPTQIICSTDVLGISIAVGPGLNAGQGATIGSGARAMRNGATTSYVPYDVYRDASYLNAYPTTGAITGITVPSDGTAFTLPIFGRVNKTSAAALPVGTYTDTLLVTLTY